MKTLAIMHLFRPLQWLKNLMIFFPSFLSGSIGHSGLPAKGIAPFLAFCCASSAAYIINDLKDLEQDAVHPLKSRRPLPSRTVTKTVALACAIILLAVATALGLKVSWLFLEYVLLYLLISIAYSLFLKDQPIFDIFCISSGFVLRLYAGGVVFDVMISDWLFLTVFLLAVFLSVGKRFSERRSLGNDSGQHRITLGKYPDGFLEGAMYLSGASVLVTYSIYVMTRPMLVYTVPLCLFGLLRYLFRIKAGEEGDPTSSLVSDPMLMITGVVWVACVAVWVY